MQIENSLERHSDFWVNDSLDNLYIYCLLSLHAHQCPIHLNTTEGAYQGVCRCSSFFQPPRTASSGEKGGEQAWEVQQAISSRVTTSLLKTVPKAMMCCSIRLSVVLKYIVHTHTHAHTLVHPKIMLTFHFKS